MLLCCYYVVIFRNRNTLLAIGVYALYSAVIIGYDELFSLWAATQSKHGEKQRHKKQFTFWSVKCDSL